MTIERGARKSHACELLNLSVWTLERWEKADGLRDKRKDAEKVVANKLTEEERKLILTTLRRPYALYMRAGGV